MIQVEKDNIKYGTCNFCRGSINKKGTRMVYPYKYVYTLESGHKSGIIVRICNKCLAELKSKTK